MKANEKLKEKLDLVYITIIVSSTCVTLSAFVFFNQLTNLQFLLLANGMGFGLVTMGVIAGTYKLYEGLPKRRVTTTA